MCGIAGILSVGRSPDELGAETILMREALGHRGPDDVGIYSDGIALAHSRLSIIDLSRGHQPLHNEDKTIKNHATLLSFGNLQ